ncbi:MAG: hypothetical protein HC785_05260 [Calothrix sp. CSU_2_0]|nr:hypothetical protein [Calothrix sp. CSU_2_0]
MSNLNSTPNLRSLGIGKVLTQLLQIRLGIAIASAFFSLIELIAKPLYQIVAPIDELLSLVSIFIALGSVIIFCVWLYRIHLDFKNLFGDYAITPGGSIARFLIPFYNIWGIANIFNTFADKFEPEGGDLNKFGKDVRSLIAPFYGCLFGSNAINRVAIQESFKNPNNPSLPLMFFISAILDIGLSFVFLSFTKAMQSAVNQKAKRTVG